MSIKQDVQAFLNTNVCSRVVLWDDFFEWYKKYRKFCKHSFCTSLAPSPQQHPYLALFLSHFILFGTLAIISKQTSLSMKKKRTFVFLLFNRNSHFLSQQFNTISPHSSIFIIYINFLKSCQQFYLFIKINLM